MRNSTTPARSFLVGTFVMLATITWTAPASAQGFISPFIGATIDETEIGCSAVIDCEDKQTTFGVAIGSLGNLFGFELDFGYTKAFFGETPTASSALLTVMGNVLIAPKIGPVQPYVLGGIGMLRSNIEFTAASLLDTSENKLGWDLGGGLMIFFGQHVGIRGDLRYIHAFQDFDFQGITIGGTKLDLGRASAAVVLKF